MNLDSEHIFHDLGKFITNKLYDYQQNHTNRLINILRINNAVLDASDTGTGKTYCAIATAKFTKKRPIIICPKSVISAWEIVAKLFDVKPLMIVNYETLRLGKMYSHFNDRVKNKYIKLFTKKDNKNTEYRWNIPDDCFFIFDEVHRCSNLLTYNARIMYAAKLTNKPLLLLSATIADYPNKFLFFTYILNFIDPEQQKDSKIEFYHYLNIMNKWIERDSKPMVRLHHMLYPDRASRIRIADLGDKFPETQISAESYYMGKKKSESIEKEYKSIAKELDNLESKTREDKKNPLVKIMRAHQKIELLKVATFVELASDYMHNGFSVVIFVNFTKTLETLCKMMNTKNMIYGQQTIKQRNDNIKKFMTNKEKIIICNIKAGGIGISLHDKGGKHPRVALLSPTWNSIDLVQALGRVHRANGKSKSLQRIIYAAKTVEEKIARKIQSKLLNISSINNGDLDMTNIKFTDKFMKRINTQNS